MKNPHVFPQPLSSGLTLRDLYAGLAMNGLAVCLKEWPDGDWKRKAAQDAYRIADAMLTEREKKHDKNQKAD